MAKKPKHARPQKRRVAESEIPPKGKGKGKGHFSETLKMPLEAMVGKKSGPNLKKQGLFTGKRGQ